MIRIPAKLESRLKEMFPRERERERFIANLIEEALEMESERDSGTPLAIGGTLQLFTDGGSRGNPGQAAIGCVLTDDEGRILEKHSERIGIRTNNVAEYEALIGGLKLAKRYHPNHLICHLDSELVVKQLKGEYRIKMASLQPLVDEIDDLKKEFADVQFKHIPRGDNFRADELVNKALDGK